MADRYWVGGSGNWDATTTTNWAATSGGAGGASAPTALDSVFFDANSNVGTSAFTVTVTGTNIAPSLCNDFTASSLDGAMILDFVFGRIDCYGSLTFPATNFSTTSTGSPAQITFSATTTGKTITTNGVSFPNLAIVFDGVGGEWTLGSAFTVSVSNRGFFVRNGTFNSGNYNITGGTLTVDTVGTQTINLGSSTYTAGNAGPSVTFTETAGLTFNAGTSTIISLALSPIFTGGGQTFYDVSFTNTASGTTTINGNNTFNNLNQISRASVGIRIIEFGANQTISGTLTLGAANLSVRRIHTTSDIVGVQRTITVNGTLATLADVDFRDIATAGSFGTWTGTRIGDGLGNSGITFTAAKDVYWSFAGGGNWPATVWATTSGGTPAANNFPLAQDRIIIGNTGLNTGATININSAWFIGELDISTRSNAMTLASAAQQPRIFKNVTLSSAVTMTGTGQWQFLGQGTTQILDVNTTIFTPPIIVNNPNGTFQLAENTTCSGTINFTQGTIDLNGFDLTCFAFISSNGNVRAINFGTNLINITGNGQLVWSTAEATNFSYTGTPTVNFTYAGSDGTRVIAGGQTNLGGTETNCVDVNISAGSDIITFGGVSRVYGNVNFTGFSGTYFNTAVSMAKNLIFSAGMTLGTGANAISFIASSGTQQLTTNGQFIDHPIAKSGVGTLQLQDDLTISSTRSFTLTSGTLDLSSDNITLSTGRFTDNSITPSTIAFGTNKIIITGSSAEVYTQAVTTTVTGTPVVDLSNTDSVLGRIIGVTNVTEENAVSFNVLGGTYSFRHTNIGGIKNLNFTGFTGTFGHNSAFIFGDLILSTGMTVEAGTFNRVFAASSGTQQLTTNGQFINHPIAKNGVGTLQLQDDLTIGSANSFTLNHGTLDLNNKVLSTGRVSASVTSLVRSIAFSTTGQIVLSGNDGTIWNTNNATNFSYTGTSNIVATYLGSEGTRQFLNGGAAGGSADIALNLHISGGTDTITVGNPFYAQNLDFTGFAGTLNDATRFMYGNLTYSSGMTLLPGTLGGSSTVFSSTSGTQQITINGQTINNGVIFNGVGGTFAFQDAFTQGNIYSFVFENGTVQFKSGTTNVVGDLYTNGTNLKYLQSTTPGTQATISKESGQINVQYLDIRDSNATGGAIFNASSKTNIDSGNNTGWKFISPSNYFLLF